MEQGKPLSDAVMEIETAVGWLRYYAALETPPELLQDDDFARVEVYRQSLGPVAAITPWNVPIALAFWKVAPALRAGNTVVLKPSPYTPLTTLRVGEMLAGVLPAGVLNVVSGLDPLGAQLTAHPAIRKITFTGSTQTGKHVAAAAAADLKRVTLELGGNDPAIVLDDAEPASVAAGIYASSMANAGQVCVAVKRAYVPRKMYSDVVDALAAHAAAAAVGNGLDAGVTMGPLNNLPQRSRVAELVADAVANGAVAVAGGRVTDSPGYFTRRPSWPMSMRGCRSWQRNSSARHCPFCPTTTWLTPSRVPTTPTSGWARRSGQAIWTAEPQWGVRSSLERHGSTRIASSCHPTLSAESSGAASVSRTGLRVCTSSPMCTCCSKIATTVCTPMCPRPSRASGGSPGSSTALSGTFVGEVFLVVGAEGSAVAGRSCPLDWSLFVPER